VSVGKVIRIQLNSNYPD